MQTTSHILMIRPVNFAFNAETATNNAFQVKNDETNVQGNALKEFDEFVALLRKNGVDVTVVEDTPNQTHLTQSFQITGSPFMAMEQSCYIQCMLQTVGLNEKNMCLKRSMNILLLKTRSI